MYTKQTKKKFTFHNLIVDFHPTTVSAGVIFAFNHAYCNVEGQSVAT